MCIGQAFRAMHAAVCCLVVMAIIGPILIIVGIVLLLSPNHRADDINQYNAAVRQWDAFEPQVGLWTGVAYPTAQGFNSAVVLYATRSGVYVQGNADGVLNATSTYLTSLQSSYSTASAGVTYVMGWGTFARTFPFSLAKTASIRCDSSSCDRYCSDSDNRRCTSSLLASTCRSRYGSSASYSGDSVCYGTDRCGTCSYTGYPTRLCAVAEIQSASTVVASTEYLSCYYPFDLDSNPYSGTSTLVTFEVRSSADPFVVMQKITKGDMDFGLTAGQQAALGLACLAIGIIISVVVFGGAIWVCRSRNQQSQPQPQPVVVASEYPPAQAQPVYPAGQQYPQQTAQQGYPQTGQPVYGQPPSEYGQAQPGGYGQPPSGYGQAQPSGYGQPPTGSGYGQPPPAYGQPQPAYRQPQEYGQPPGYAQPAGYGHQGPTPPEKQNPAVVQAV